MTFDSGSKKLYSSVLSFFSPLFSYFSFLFFTLYNYYACHRFHSVVWVVLFYWLSIASCSEGISFCAQKRWGNFCSFLFREIVCGGQFVSVILIQVGLFLSLFFFPACWIWSRTITMASFNSFLIDLFGCLDSFGCSFLFLLFVCFVCLSVSLFPLP